MRNIQEITGGIEKCYHNQAQDLVDLLFDKRYLAEDLSRESIDWLEGYKATEIFGGYACLNQI